MRCAGFVRMERCFVGRLRNAVADRGATANTGARLSYAISHGFSAGILDAERVRRARVDPRRHRGGLSRVF